MHFHLMVFQKGKQLLKSRGLTSSSYILSISLDQTQPLGIQLHSPRTVQPVHWYRLDPSVTPSCSAPASTTASPPKCRSTRKSWRSSCASTSTTEWQEFGGSWWQVTLCHGSCDAVVQECSFSLSLHPTIAELCSLKLHSRKHIAQFIAHRRIHQLSHPLIRLLQTLWLIIRNTISIRKPSHSPVHRQCAATHFRTSSLSLAYHQIRIVHKTPKCALHRRMSQCAQRRTIGVGSAQLCKTRNATYTSTRRCSTVRLNKCACANASDTQIFNVL